MLSIFSTISVDHQDLSVKFTNYAYGTNTDMSQIGATTFSQEFDKVSSSHQANGLSVNRIYKMWLVRYMKSAYCSLPNPCLRSLNLVIEIAGIGPICADGSVGSYALDIFETMLAHEDPSNIISESIC